MEKVTMLKLGYRISFGFQHRVFSVPWVKRNSVTLCLERRDYTSSVPVRYIPKKSRKANENATSQEDKYASSWDSNASGCEVANNVRGVRRSIFLDPKKQNQTGKYKNSSRDNARQVLEDQVKYDNGFRDDELMTEPGDVIEEIRVHTEEGSSKRGTSTAQARKTTQDTENMAIEFLASRAYTTLELRKKLIGKRFSPDIVDGVITDFQRRGLINDSLYAESFSRSRWSSSTWGPRRIKQALFKKGLSEADAEEAVRLVFEDGECNNDGDQEVKLGLSKQAMEQLYVQASKQWVRGKGIGKETRKSRIIRWLQYRGFNWGVISFLLNKLQSQQPLD